ncbi:transglycosylase domain-containing protein [Rhodococcus sp. NPDC019627]|uniref:transglycosylase domain-containing protein n=1 Tax=unclassified Rhodococcus (in: high G+C Gram-positive bacteria) TaxID=192944 RepID=UPI0033DB04CF
MSSGNDATGDGTAESGGTPVGDDGAAATSTPRAGKKKSRRWRTVRRVGLGVMALMLVIPLVMFLVSYVQAEVPRPSDMKTNQVATVFAADGATELAKVIPPEGNRTEIALGEIPQHVRDAVLSAEDRNFYSNPGFSIAGFVRAARDNVLGKESAGGGSTITQQYVKNVLVGADRNVYRKMRELVISTKMAREWSKDEILAAYLNTIYFGRGAYGIEAASRAYFDKPVGELSVAEGAVLASVIQSPSYLDPEANVDQLQARWNYVLDGMVEMGVLTSQDRSEIEFPAAAPANRPTDANSAPGPEGLIRNQVLRELSDAGISEQTLNTEGLQITTTIDPKAQQAAIDSVHETLEGEDPGLRTAVVSIDPRTGGVRAYYGGEDGAGFDYAQAPLQTGSSFKVFGLAAALEQGIPLSARFSSAPLTVGNVQIGNVEGESCGTCTIAEATKRSLNTSFYRLMMSLDNGPQAIADAAHKAGIPEFIPGVQGKTLSENGGEPEGGIVLGQYLSRPIDMASAYATLAASGIYHPPYFVQRVVTADGVVLFDRAPSPGERRLEAAVADNISQALMPVAAYSRGHALAGGRPSAAKTGTAQLGDTGENKDAWMVGYTPSLSTAVWIGKADATAINNSWGGLIYGSSLPSDIWKGTMDGALEDTDWEEFPWPDPIGGQAGVPSWSGVSSSGSGSGSGNGQTANPPPAPAPVEAPPPAPLPPIQPPPQLQLPAPTQIEILPGVIIPLPG